MTAHDCVTPGQLYVVDCQVRVLASDHDLVFDIERLTSERTADCPQPCHSAGRLQERAEGLQPTPAGVGVCADDRYIPHMNSAMARLEVVAGRAIGMSILIDDELLIGRHAEGAGRLADDEEISRSHARLSLDRTGFCAIEDLGSTNGTYVNGMRIKGPETLSEGDTIEVGATTLVVRELPIPHSEHTLRAIPARPTVVRRWRGSGPRQDPGGWAPPRPRLRGPRAGRGIRTTAGAGHHREPPLQGRKARRQAGSTAREPVPDAGDRLGGAQGHPLGRRRKAAEARARRRHVAPLVGRRLNLLTRPPLPPGAVRTCRRGTRAAGDRRAARARAPRR